MRPPGRPKGEYRGAQHEGSPVRPLNILYVGTMPPHPGGSAISGYQLLGCLARLGHAVRVLAPTTPAARSCSTALDASHAQIATTRFEVPHFEIPP